MLSFDVRNPPRVSVTPRPILAPPARQPRLKKRITFCALPKEEQAAVLREFEAIRKELLLGEK